MASGDRTPSPHIVTLDVFNRVIHDLTAKAVCGREFVRVGKLKEWLNSPGPSKDYANQRKQIDLLAHAAYEHSLDSSIHPPIHESILLRICPLTFCILVQLKHGHLIECFQRQHLDDSSLSTMDSGTLQTKVESVCSDPSLNPKHSAAEAASLAKNFDELRWKFFIPNFEMHQGDLFSKKHILPIIQKNEINNKGGTATLYRIEVLEEFVGKSLREAVSNSVRDKKDGLGNRYTFAMKSFHERYKRRFENEKQAFVGFQHNGMVRYLANFDHEEVDKLDAESGQRDCLKTYNILLEYGDYDLSEYFIRNDPPLPSSQILEFWQDLFEVAETVKGIHKIKDHYSIFRGWHADIKPDNILLVQGKFKLADPGFMKFVSEQSHNAKEAEKAVMEGGTRTYGAPEMHTTKFPVSQTIDIWSLGCVFSIAATWVVIGRKGVAWFYKSRIEAIKNLGLQPDATSKQQGDQFHDGEKLLDAVKAWHHVLRGFIRASDHITKQVLDIVETHMLVTDPDHRDKAETLCTRLQTLLQDIHKPKPQVEFPQNIMDAIKAADNAAPVTSAAIEKSIDALMEERRKPISSEKREDLTSEVLNLVAMSNAGRSSSFKYGLPEKPEGKNSPLEAVVKSNGEPQLTNGVKKNSLELVESHKRPRGIAKLSIISNVQKEPPPHNHLNIFDAHQALDLGSSSFFRKLSQGVRGDAYLADHYKDRDIIFLADNSESMAPLWSQATFVLGTLFRMMALQRDVGMRLLFTFGKPPKAKTKEDIKKIMNSDEIKPRSYRRTDIATSLGEIFHDCIQRIKTPWPTHKRLTTIMILTDGVWEGTKSKGEVKTKIAKFVREVTELQGQHRKRPVSIQFIQFGRDLEAMFFLQHLDNHLAADEGVPDVIDWEPADGDVYNMLLGSFVEDIDSREPAEVVVGSPS